MKILSAEQIKRLDKFTIAHEPIAPIHLMERASRKFADELVALLEKNKRRKVAVFCGAGNNGGDGLAVARMMHEAGFEVRAFLLKNDSELSSETATNFHRLSESMIVHTIQESSDFPKLEADEIVVDALYGIGLNRPLGGLTKTLVQHINQSNCTVCSIDVPSGLMANGSNNPDDVAIHADYTFTFHCPKLSFMFAENEKRVGEWKVLDIGLSREGEAAIGTQSFFITAGSLAFLKKKHSRFAHKNMFGHALICAGSFGMMGAAVFSVRAALKSGCGLVSACVPRCGYAVMQTSAPEAMVACAENESFISLPHDVSKYDAVAIGPGISTDATAKNVLEKLLAQQPRKLVVDADALNILSGNNHLFQRLPENSVLTPHPGEFKRLIGRNWANDAEKLELLKQFAAAHKLVVILKGANTVVATPAGELFFNSTGNTGMAKGGSGDVLTGVVVSLLAQGFSSVEAAVAAVFIHGYAADRALEKQGRFSMNASDIIFQLSEAFKLFNEANDVG